MGTRKGRRIAIGTVLAVVLLAGMLLWLGRDHIRFVLAFESLGPNAQGYAEYSHRQTGIVFVSLPGGTFPMGSPAEEEGHRANEGPVHQVTLSPFMIAKYEVTQAQWKALMGSNASKFKGEDLPVETVSWDDCQEFGAKSGLLLPSEAQWEYACRAGTTGPFSGCGRIEDMGWYSANGVGGTREVGLKQPNGFGLHDTHGNVWECCKDVYDEEFYSRPAAARRDPVSDCGSEDRLSRGGVWCFFSDVCRSARRFKFPPSTRVSLIGCRLASSVP